MKTCPAARWWTCLHPQNLGEGLIFWIHNPKIPKGHRSIWDNNCIIATCFFNFRLYICWWISNQSWISQKKLPSTTKDQLGKTQVNKESRPIHLRGSHCKPQRRGIDLVRTLQGRLNVTIWRVFSHISSWCVFSRKVFQTDHCERSSFLYASPKFHLYQK